MFVSLNYRIKRHRNRIVLLVFGSIFFVLSFVFLASDLSSRFVFWALTLVVSLFLLPFGISYTASVGKSKKVLRKGQATFGELVNNLWNADRYITFYYKLEDGRIGKVIQQISKRAATKLDEGKFTNIPISILGIRAVFDESRLSESSTEDLHLKETIIETKDTTTYAKLSDGVVYFALALISLLVILIPSIYVNSVRVAYGMPLMMPFFEFVFFNPFIPLFITLGFVKSRNYYFIGKIKNEDRLVREQAEKKKLKYEQKYGYLVPLKNTDVKSKKFNKGNFVSFIYQGEDGTYYRTIESISGKARRRINKRGEDKVEIIVWNNKAIVDEYTLLNKELTDLQFSINFIKDHDIPFYALVAVNLYFFINELVAAISSHFKSSISVFNTALYFFTIAYLVVMFLLEKFAKKTIHAYWVTILFLIVNMVVLPLIFMVSRISGETSLFIKAQTFFTSGFISGLTVFIYTSFLFIRFIYMILKSHQSKALGEHYERCQNFGYIVSSFYTFVVFLFSLVLTTFTMGYDSEAVMEFEEGADFMIFFIVLIIGMSVLSLILLIKCIKGMIHREKKVRIRKVPEIEEY